MDDKVRETASFYESAVDSYSISSRICFYHAE